MEVGNPVLAIDNLSGVDRTSKSGLVSAETRTWVGISNFDVFIPTDAAINLGNSVGALVDMNGQLISVNTAIYSCSKGLVGFGLVSPADLVHAVIASKKWSSNIYFFSLWCVV